MSKSKAEIRILVVDDEPLMSDSLRQHLADEGYAVDIASSGAEAIDLFDGGAHHLVICDLQLPDLEGKELLDRMTEKESRSQVIVMTAHGTISNIMDAMKHGAKLMAPVQERNRAR